MNNSTQPGTNQIDQNVFAGLLMKVYNSHNARKKVHILTAQLFHNYLTQSILHDDAIEGCAAIACHLPEAKLYLDYKPYVAVAHVMETLKGGVYVPTLASLLQELINVNRYLVEHKSVLLKYASQIAFRLDSYQYPRGALTLSIVYYWQRKEGIEYQLILPDDVRFQEPNVDGILVYVTQTLEEYQSPSYDDSLNLTLPRPPEFQTKIDGLDPDISSEEIGQGKGGRVYSISGVALKVSYVKKIHSLITEVAALSSLRHPNVVEIKSFLLNLCYTQIIMNLADSTLADLIESSDQSLEENRLTWTRELLRGLAYIHSCGIIHCDIKPRNLLITKGVLQIADMDISRFYHTSAGRVSSDIYRICSICYQPIDILIAQREEERSASDSSYSSYSFSFDVDIWAAACTIHEIYTGAHLVEDMFHYNREDVIVAIENVLGVYPEYNPSGLIVTDPVIRQLLIRMFTYDNRQRIRAVEALAILPEV